VAKKEKEEKYTGKMKCRISPPKRKDFKVYTNSGLAMAVSVATVGRLNILSVVCRDHSSVPLTTDDLVILLFGLFGILIFKGECSFLVIPAGMTAEVVIPTE